MAHTHKPLLSQFHPCAKLLHWFSLLNKNTAYYPYRFLPLCSHKMVPDSQLSIAVMHCYLFAVSQQIMLLLCQDDHYMETIIIIIMKKYTWSQLRNYDDHNYLKSSQEQMSYLLIFRNLTAVSYWYRQPLWFNPMHITVLISMNILTPQEQRKMLDFKLNSISMGYKHVYAIWMIPVCDFW